MLIFQNGLFTWRFGLAVELWVGCLVSSGLKRCVRRRRPQKQKKYFAQLPLGFAWAAQVEERLRRGLATKVDKQILVATAGCINGCCAAVAVCRCKVLSDKTNLT